MPTKITLLSLLLALTLTGHTQTAAEIAGWPKVELHLHLDCSLSYAVVHQLDPGITPDEYQKQFIAPAVCTNLADYITRADRSVGLMQTLQALRLVTLDLFHQLQKDHIVYAEFRFAPLKHLSKGLTGEQVVAAVDSAVAEGIRSTGIQVGIILCTLRHFNKEQSMETVKLVEKFRGRHVVGFDIAADEAGFPIDAHVAAFRYANAHGIPCTAHAGEAAGPKSVWETLNNFHPTRIGHGVRSAEDTALLRYLQDKNILLEVCPTSNLQTNIYPDLAHHPVDRLHKAQVPLNINTDCRTISNTTLTREYGRVVDQFHWKKADFLATNLAAIDHAFTTPAIKSRLKAQLRAAYGTKPIITGADQTSLYLPLLKGKRIGILGNPTTIIGNRSLVDSLHTLKVDIKENFGPEHGFRGKASNGAKVADETDSATGIPIISLYGPKRKPSKEDMDAIDIMIFDLQDVGCRFYTNINVLRNIMEACAESGKELLILDRPDPNGYVDGPILDMSLKSGIGQFPVPIVHGMTIGEFAKMINGEGWLPNRAQCKLTVIPVKNYAHSMYYQLPVFPSPNLNSQQSVLLYPSLCLFEGTIISQGRGTHMPFTVLGNPDLKGKYPFSFTPVSIPGMSETPLHQDQACYGLDLRSINADSLRKTGKLNIKWMMALYKAYPYKEKFFDFHQSKQMGDINKLAGTTAFKEQIASGMSESDIRKTWEPGLSNYKQMRKKYLLYP